MTRLGLKVFGSGLSETNIFYTLFLKLNWLHYEIVLFFLVIVLMIVVSVFTPRAEPQAIKGLYFGSVSPEERAITRASWNNWDLLFSGLIIVVIIAFYIYFW